MIFQITEQSIKQAAQILIKGGIVAFPTETVYGLGSDAFNTEAVARVFKVKKRPFFDPLIIHIADNAYIKKIADLSLLTPEAKDKLDILSKKLMPGPLTLILPKLSNVPDITTGGLNTAAVRFPLHAGAQRLIDASTGAIAAPSANPFGYLSPTTAMHVSEQLGSSVDMILDGGQCSIGIESTVLDLSSSVCRILRSGGTSKKTIEDLIGSVAENDCQNDNHAAITSPGELKSHYAPKTKMILYGYDQVCSIPYDQNDNNAAYLFFDRASYNKWQTNQKNNLQNVNTKKNIFLLSNNGNDSQAAANLFGMLHTIDKLSQSTIYAQAAPQEGLGQAINDRLKKASNH